MRVVLFVLGFTIFAVAAFYGLLSLSNTRGGNKELLKGIALGAFTPRSQVTEAGWRYRNYAIALAVVAVLILLLASALT